MKLKIVESGSVVVFNRNKISCAKALKIENLGNNLWKIKLPSGKQGVEITIITV